MNPSKYDPLILIFAGIIFFTMVLIYCNHMFPNDGQVFQVVAGVLTGFVGAFLGRVKPPKSDADDAATPTTLSVPALPPEPGK